MVRDALDLYQRQHGALPNMANGGNGMAGGDANVNVNVQTREQMQLAYGPNGLVVNM